LDEGLCYPRRVIRALCLLLALPLLACSHTDKTEGPTALKKTADDFMRRVRWNDFPSASELVVPEKRDAFVHDRRKARDDKDLKIDNYDLNELKMAPDAMSGQVEADLSYYKLPSISLKEDSVTLFLVFRDGHWLVDHMVGGPFEDLH
jgi:hypothetical protein